MCIMDLAQTGTSTYISKNVHMYFCYKLLWKIWGHYMNDCTVLGNTTSSTIFQCSETMKSLQPPWQMLSWVQVLGPIIQMPHSIPVPPLLFMLKRKSGYFHCVLGVQTHSEPPVFLVRFRKYLATMNGVPVPNSKWLLAQGIEHRLQISWSIIPHLTPLR